MTQPESHASQQPKELQQPTFDPFAFYLGVAFVMAALGIAANVVYDVATDGLRMVHEHGSYGLAVFIGGIVGTVLIRKGVAR